MAVAAVAELAPTKLSNHQPQTGEYARSHLALWRWGGSLALGAEAFDTHRVISYDNYTSALREMLRTDGQYREKLDIEDVREHQIINGVAVAADGTPMHEVVTAGRISSEQAAVENPLLWAQVIRDKGDEHNAHRVDAMPSGRTRFALSMEPKDELQKYRKTYRGLGYRKNLAFLQTYSKVGDTLVAASYSIDMSDEATWRSVFADLGVDIPADESPNTWIRNGFERDCSPEQAADLALQIRAEYYQRRGVTGKRHSVSEYLDSHEETVKGLFDAYYPALAEAVFTGKNNETMQDFAKAILQTNLRKMKPEIKRSLMRVANSQRFDVELGQAMDEVLRYAVVEELREGLAELVGSTEPSARQNSGEIAVKQVVSKSYTINAADWNHRLANRVEDGIEAGRSYGGCSSVELDGTDSVDPLDVVGARQGGYGGYGGRRKRNKNSYLDGDEEDDAMYCVNCPKCSTEHDELRPDKDGYYCCKNKNCGHKVKKATVSPPTV